MSRSKRIIDYLVIFFAALLLGLSYHLFVYPNDFAPSGIPGFATMLQYLFDFKVSYLTVIINVPLVIATYFMVGKDYALKSAAFTAVFSTVLLIFEYVPLDRFAYYTENGTSTIMAPVAAGVVCGFCYGIVMRRNGSTGGTDLVAALVNKRHPEYNLLWILFSINAMVAATSYFVYGFKFEPVIMCIVYSFLTSQVSDMMLKGFKEAVKFEIITDQPEELAKALREKLYHGVTELPAKGSFSRKDKTLLICVVNKREIVKFQRILNDFPGSFAYMTSVKETMGNFRRGK